MAPPVPSSDPLSLRKNTDGAVYVEFLIVFIPFFIMVLGMMQIALMYAAHLAVQHAATTAARAAIVVFPDCEARYDGAAQNVVNGGGRGDDPASMLTSIFGGGGGASFPGLGGSGSSGGARVDAVRFAANLPMVSSSPSLQELEGDLMPSRQNVLAAIGGTGSAAVRLAIGALGYNNVALAVNFPDRPNTAGATLQTRFARRAPVTARVTYLFHCGIPIVSAMACDDAISVFSGVPYRQLMHLTRSLSAGHFRESAGLETARREAQSRLRRADYGLLSRELESTGAGAALSAAYLTLSRGNFSIIRAEATLPLQGHEAASLARPCFNVRR
jgi:hypothetical protein